MQIKKITPLVLALALTACGGETTTTDNTQANEDLTARIEELEAENSELKQQLEEANSKTEETAAAEATQEKVADNNEDEEVQTSSSLEQVVQTQSGNIQEENYFTWETKNGIYKQTGDAIITNSEYNDQQILVIPINFTNKSDEAIDPWFAFVMDFEAYQEDENHEYSLNGGQGAVPDEFDTSINADVKSGGSTDWYITYTLEQPNKDIMVRPRLGNGEFYTFKLN